MAAKMLHIQMQLQQHVRPKAISANGKKTQPWIDKPEIRVGTNFSSFFTTTDMDDILPQNQSESETNEF